MFRTVKVKLTGNLEPLLETTSLYTQACQLALDYGFMNKTCSKKKINVGTYTQTRKQIPQLPSALVQCARDLAAEILKREGCKMLSTKKNLQARYDKRTFKFYPESGKGPISIPKGKAAEYRHCFCQPDGS